MTYSIQGSFPDLICLVRFCGISPNVPPGIFLLSFALSCNIYLL